MKVFNILLLITTSSATIYPFNKPHKLYKTLVEPFLDLALRSVVTGSVVDPLGHLIGGFGHKGKHHKKNRYGSLPIPFLMGGPYHQEGPYHPPVPIIHEREVIYHYGIPPGHAPVHHESFPYQHQGGNLNHQLGYLDHQVGPSVPLIGEHLTPFYGETLLHSEPGHFK